MTIDFFRGESAINISVNYMETLMSGSVVASGCLMNGQLEIF